MVDACTCIFGTRILQNHTLALIQEIEGVRLAKDIECIHRMRVATRRLRAAFPLFGNCFSKNKLAKWNHQIRQITRALGEARDTDVQIEKLASTLSDSTDKRFRPGISRLILRLNQRRGGLQANVNKALDQLQIACVIDDMQSEFNRVLTRDVENPTFSCALYQHAHAALESKLKELISFETFIFDPNCVAELHAMRIAAKHLRYTMEIFAPLYPNELKEPIQSIRKAQDTLGNIHDCDVWQIFLENFQADELNRVKLFYGSGAPFRFLIPGLEFFRDETLRERKQTYENFLDDWITWQNLKTWDDLRETVQKPLSILQEPPYPHWLPAQ